MEPLESTPAAKRLHQMDVETLSRVLHDLKTPLTVMYGRSQLLERYILRGRILKPHKCLSGLAAIEQAIQRMEAMLKNLMGRDQDEWFSPPTGRGMPDPDGGPLL